MKQLLDAEQYAFLAKKESSLELYRSKKDNLKEIGMTEGLVGEMEGLQNGHVYELNESLPELAKIFQIEFHQRTFLLQFEHGMQKVVFAYYWDQNYKKTVQRKFISKSNFFGFSPELIDFSSFIFETIITAKVQYYKYGWGD